MRIDRHNNIISVSLKCGLPVYYLGARADAALTYDDDDAVMLLEAMRSAFVLFMSFLKRMK